MKSVSPELLALLATEKWFMADLYTISLVSGSVLRYNTFDMDVTADGHVFSCSGPLIKRAAITWRLGVEVDELELTVHPVPVEPFFAAALSYGDGYLLDQDGGLILVERAETPSYIDGIPFLAALRRGALDGADITVRRAFMPTPGDTSVGTVLIFHGSVSGIDADRTSARITIASPLERLNIMLPRGLYSPTCILTLFDTVCGLNRAAYTSSGVVGEGATTRLIPVSGVIADEGYYSQGVLSLAGGTIRRTIASWSGGVARLISPLLDAPAEGDAVEMTAGCSKTLARCREFDNTTRFHGEPWIPEPETAI